MIIDGTKPIDLTGLNKRDIRDIEKDLAKERKSFESMGWDKHTVDSMTDAIYYALVLCKKINKEKYTPKKYRRNANAQI